MHRCGSGVSASAGAAIFPSGALPQEEPEHVSSEGLLDDAGPRRTRSMFRNISSITATDEQVASIARGPKRELMRGNQSAHAGEDLLESTRARNQVGSVLKAP